MRHIFRYLFGQLLLIALATTAHASPIIAAHYGATDPTMEGFAAFTLPPPFTPAPSTVGPLANDAGRAAWSIAGTGQSSLFGYLSGPLSPSQQADVLNQGFILTLEARADRQGIASPFSPNNPVIVAGAIVETASSRFELNLGLDANGDTVVSLPTTVGFTTEGAVLSDGLTYTLAGLGGGYHNYSLIYDPITQLADLFIDGVPRISDYGGVTNFPSFDRGLVWGAFSGGLGNFAVVQLEAIPAPSSLLLLILGLVGLAGRRWTAAGGRVLSSQLWKSISA